MTAAYDALAAEVQKTRDFVNQAQHALTPDMPVDWFKQVMVLALMAIAGIWLFFQFKAGLKFATAVTHLGATASELSVRELERAVGLPAGLSMAALLAAGVFAMIMCVSSALM